MAGFGLSVFGVVVEGFARDESALQQQVRELQAELKRVSDKNVVLEATLKRVRGKNKVQARTIVYLQNQLEASQDSDSYNSNDSDYSNDRLEQVPDSDSFDDGWPSSPVSRTQTETSPTFQESGGSTDTIETPPKNSPARTPRPAGSSQSSEFGDSQSLSSGQALVRGRGGVDNQEGSERGLFPNAGNDDWGAAVLGDSFSTLGGDADVFSDDSQNAAPNATLYSTSLAMDRTAKASVSALQWIETGYASSPSTAAGSPASIAAREGAYSASSTSASAEVPVTSHASPFAAPRSPDSADTSTAYLEGSGGSVVEREQDSSVPGLEEESEAGGDDIGSNFFSDDGSEQSKQKTKQDGPPAYVESGIFDGRRKMVHVEGSPQTVNVTAENPRRKLSVYDPKEKSTMYEFDLVVKQSAIPGAKLGAFITFTQAFGRNGTSKTSETYDTPMDQQTFFDGRNLSIDLGKYHRKEDVVDDEPFVLKSFLFCQRPDVYAYTLKKKPQKTHADLSSNTSGEPHEHATAQVPMYVNEVGHNPKLEQNVYASRRPGEDFIRYDFAPNDVMQIGKEMELLTHYGDGYEPIRERYGYGWRDGKEPAPSGHESFARRLERNLSYRVTAHTVINEIDTEIDTANQENKNPKNVLTLVEGISMNMWAPIYLQIREKQKPLKPAQLVAVQRLYWVVNKFQDAVNQKKLDMPDETHGMILRAPQTNVLEVELVEKAEKMLQSMKREIGSALKGLDAESREALKDDRIEEICYALQEKLPLAMNEAVYCQVALDLLGALFQAMLDSDSAQDRLTAFYEAGEKAKNAILLCVEESNCEKLEFASGVSAGTKLSGSLGGILGTVKTSSAFFLQYNTTPKGVRAALIDACPNLKAKEDERDNICRAIGDRFVMVNVNEDRLDNDRSKKLAALGSKPVDSRIATTGEINVTWYIHWQVLYIVDLFASSYCGEAEYKLSTLCSKLGAKELLAQFVVRRGIRDKFDGQGYRDYLQRQTLE